MDGATPPFFNNGKTDAFFQIEFAGAKPLPSKVVTMQGSRKQLNPEFNSTLWYPMTYPTSTNVIKMSMWDYDRFPSPNELIASFYAKYGVIDKISTKTTGVHWVNLYGAPEQKDGNIVDTVRKVAVQAGNLANQAVLGSIDPYEYYNKNPDKASTFKGRVLLSITLEKELPPAYHAKHKDQSVKTPFRMKAKMLSTFPVIYFNVLYLILGINFY